MLGWKGPKVGGASHKGRRENLSRKKTSSANRRLRQPSRAVSLRLASSMPDAPPLSRAGRAGARGRQPLPASGCSTAPRIRSRLCDLSSSTNCRPCRSSALPDARSICGRSSACCRAGAATFSMARANIALGLSGAVEALKLIERHRRENRSRPGAEILGGDVLAGDFPEIVVHVGRCDVLAIAVFVDVLEQFLAGQILARFYDLGDAPVPDPQRPLLAALAGKAERTSFPSTATCRFFSVVRP